MVCRVVCECPSLQHHDARKSHANKRRPHSHICPSDGGIPQNAQGSETFVRAPNSCYLYLVNQFLFQLHSSNMSRGQVDISNTHHRRKDFRSRPQILPFTSPWKTESIPIRLLLSISISLCSL